MTFYLVEDDVIAGLTGNLKPGKFSNFRRNTRIYLSLQAENGDAA
jgi:hypothetical protein